MATSDPKMMITLFLLVVRLESFHLGTMSKAPKPRALSTPVEPDFASPLWESTSLDRPFILLRDSENVTCTIYEIGGALTSVLSTTCSKELPLIPHVGVRLFGTEYFYSDHVESRPIPVMNDMLGTFPQVTFDLGPPKVTPDELQTFLDDIDAEWCAETYNVFDHNCNHFAKIFANYVASDPLPDHIIDPVLQVTEDMLSELPDWRRNLGQNLMNQITRLVVVSWGRATKRQKLQLTAAQVSPS